MMVLMPRKLSGLAGYLAHIALLVANDSEKFDFYRYNPHILSKLIPDNYRDFVTGVMLPNKNVISVSRYAVAVLNTFITRLDIIIANE